MVSFPQSSLARLVSSKAKKPNIYNRIKTLPSPFFSIPVFSSSTTFFSSYSSFHSRTFRLPLECKLRDRNSSHIPSLSPIRSSHRRRGSTIQAQGIDIVWVCGAKNDLYACPFCLISSVLLMKGKDGKEMRIGWEEGGGGWERNPGDENGKGQ